MISPRLYRYRGICALAVICILAGCGGGGTSRPAGEATLFRPSSAERLAYSPPSGPPAQPLDTKADASVGTVWDRAERNLTALGFSFYLIDERDGIMVGRYSGPPANFVDCGTVIAEPVNGGSTRSVRATTQTVAFGREWNGEATAVERGLQLDARIVIELDNAEGGTDVRANATYVVTKRIKANGVGPMLESVTFDSGGEGRFGKGTICRPTGVLERIALVGSA